MSVESGERMEESASQLSAMFDGELSAAECELLSRRLARDEALRGRWARYALIGAAMRAEPIATVSGGFARRVGKAIDQQNGRQDGQLDGQMNLNGQMNGQMNGKLRASGTAGFMRFRTVALGGTLAAGVAAVAVFMLRNEMLSHNEALVARTPAVQRLAAPGAKAANAMVASTVVAGSNSREPASYIVPPGSNSMMSPVPVSLANYVVAHSEYSSPLARRGLLSSLVASESGEMTVTTAAAQGPVRSDPTIVVEAGR